MKNYGLIAMLALLTACAPQPRASSAMRAIQDPTVGTYDAASSPVPPLACPSEDFPVFLMRFADASFSYYREQYTTLPLEY